MINRIKITQSKPAIMHTCRCGAHYIKYNSLQKQCPKCTAKAAKPLQSRQGLKTTKPMRKIGKYGKLNAKVSRQHRKDNPPNHEGYFICIYCGKWALPGEINGEHTDSKARHPEERMNLKKMADGCSTCNQLKGSLSKEEYLQKLKEKTDGRN